MAEGNIEQIHTQILDSKRETVNKVADLLQISHSSAYEIIHDRPHFHEVCAN